MPIVFRSSILKRLRRVAAGVATGVIVLTTLPSATPPAEAATSTLWGTGVPAGVALAGDTRAVELGTRFKAKTTGKATGVRFFKADGVTGKHTGTLWSSKGKKLATVTFKNESAYGWQSASFAKAVKLKAGKAYVVSYHVPKGGRYAASVDFHGSFTSSALSVSTRNSGSFRYGSKVAFPRSTWRSSQYWVDVNSKFTGTSAAATPTVAPTTAAPTTAAPTIAANGFPTRQNTGVPAGWTPKTTRSGDYTITEDGAVVEDLRLSSGTLYVRASNVTLRRVELVSARIVNDYGRSCYNGLRIEDSSILRGSQDLGMPVVEAGGYTALRVKIDGPSEGFRVGESALGCGPVVIQDSWMKLDPPDNCVADAVDWHGDGIQGYQGAEVTVRNSYINLAQVKGCLGTAAFFYPVNQGNARATIDHVLLEGGGYVFRLGTPGSVSGLKVIDDSWEWGPVDVTDCSVVAWGSGNELVTVNTDGSLKSVRPLACTSP